MAAPNYFSAYRAEIVPTNRNKIRRRCSADLVLRPAFYRKGVDPVRLQWLVVRNCSSFYAGQVGNAIQEVVIETINPDTVAILRVWQRKTQRQQVFFLNPGSTWLKRQKLFRSSPALATNKTATATCNTTSDWRNR